MKEKIVGNLKLIEIETERIEEDVQVTKFRLLQIKYAN